MLRAAKCTEMPQGMPIDKLTQCAAHRSTDRPAGYTIKERQRWRSFSPLISMSNLHPATAPHIRRAIARRERRNAIARVSMFLGSSALFAVVALASVNPAKEGNTAALAALSFGACVSAASLVCGVGAAADAASEA